jgi:hypothetical protein
VNAARFNGGPLDGETRITPDEAGWPLPDEFKLGLLSDADTNFVIGYYVRTNQSQLDDEVASHPGLMRGAEYSWREDLLENDQ